MAARSRKGRPKTGTEDAISPPDETGGGDVLLESGDGRIALENDSMHPQPVRTFHASIPLAITSRAAKVLRRVAELEQHRIDAKSGRLQLIVEPGTLRLEIAALREEAIALREELARLPAVPPKRERRRPLPVRTGKAFLATVNATPDRVNKARRKAKGLAGVNAEAERLFLSGDYRPLGAYERAAIVGLVNMAWDAGVLEGLDAAKQERRIVDPTKASVEQSPPRVKIPFKGYAAIARRAGAQEDDEGRIPQHITRAVEGAIEELTNSPRLIPEPVRLRTDNGLVNTFAVRSALWIEKEVVVDPNGEQGAAERTFLWLDVAACTAMLDSWVDRPLLADYERARKESGAAELRDDLVALEDYLTWRRNTELGAQRGGEKKHKRPPKGNRSRTTAQSATVAAEVPAPNAATEADRVVVVKVAKADLWRDMGWAKEAKKRGPKAGQKRQDEGLAWCRARGILVKHEEQEGEKGPVLVFTLAASMHPDPAQGTLFLPGAGE